MLEKWTIARVLQWTREHFQTRGLRTPSLDAELIIALALSMDRVGLYIHSEKPLSVEERDRIKELIRRRLDGEPVAYITGVKEFWGMELRVTPDVLVPRPETEEIIEDAGAIFKSHRDDILSFADLGTGSGCLTAGLCAEFPRAVCVAVDISEPALEVARGNIEKFGFSDRVKFRAGDFFSALQEGDAPFDLIVANPPYVPVGEIRDLAPEVKRETRIALDGGADGLDPARRILDDAEKYLNPGGWLLMEIGSGQDESIEEINTGSDFEFRGFRKDLAGINRVARWSKK